MSAPSEKGSEGALASGQGLLGALRGDERLDRQGEPLLQTGITDRGQSGFRETPLLLIYGIQCLTVAQKLGQCDTYFKS